MAAGKNNLEVGIQFTGDASDLSKATKDIRANLEGLTNEAKKAGQTLNEALAAKKTGLTPKDIRELEARYKDAGAALYKLGENGKRAAKDLTDGMRAANDETGKTTASIKDMAAGIATAGAVVLGAVVSFKAAISGAIEFEAAFANVRKVVDGTPEQLERLRKDILEMTKTLPLTAKELTEIAAAGGQLGVTIPDMQKFVELAAKMSTAFGISPGEAADAIALIQNIYGLSIEQIERLGDAINHLGNNTNATERDILNVMNRIGGMAKNMGIAAKDAAGLAGAMLSLGKAPQVASTALNALLMKLQTIPAADKKAKDAFASLGLSVNKFAAEMNANPIAAITKFLNKLRELDAGTRTMTLTSIFGREYADDIGLLVENVDKLKESLGLANAEASKGSLNKEFGERAKTTQANLTLLGNAFANMGITLGSIFLPAITRAAQALSSVINYIAELIGQFPKITAALTAIAGLFLGWLAYSGLVKTLTAAFTGLSAALGMTTTAATALGLVVARFLGLIGLFVVAVQAGGAAMEWFLNKFGGLDKLERETKALERSVKVHQEFNKVIKQLDSAGATRFADAIRQIKQQALDSDGDYTELLNKAKEYAAEALRLEKDLQANKARLIQLEAQERDILNGKVKLSDKERYDKAIEGAKKQLEASKKALNDELDAVKRFTEQAKRYREEAANVGIAARDKVRDLRRRDMTEEQQQADILAQANEKLSASYEAAARARALAAAGDLPGAEKAAEQAKKFAEQTGNLGERLKDTSQAIGIVEKAAEAEAAALNTAAAANEQAAAKAQNAAEKVKAQIKQIEAEITRLEREKAVIEIRLEIAQAKENIRSLEDALVKLAEKMEKETGIKVNFDANTDPARQTVNQFKEQVSKERTESDHNIRPDTGEVDAEFSRLNGTVTHSTHVVHVQTVEEHAAGGPVGMFRRMGGAIRGPGTSTSDSIFAKLSNGEFVVRAAMVRKWGEGFFRALNAGFMPSMPVPRYAAGGIVGSSDGGSSGDEVTINLNMGNRKMKLRSSRDTAMQLADALTELSRAS